MKPFFQLLADFKQAAQGMRKLQSRLPAIIGNEAVKQVRNNFKIQGYFVSGTWKKREAVTNRAYSYNRRKGSRTKTGRISKAKNQYKGSVYNASSPLLLQTRNLFRSIRYTPKGARSVFIGTDLALIVYAQKMNEGGPGTWGKHAKTDTSPRKFMPVKNETLPPQIYKAIVKKYENERDKVMRLFKR